ncbi:MAG: hypothetical protein IPH99_04515 [Xanthomonadales bacterium]|nr:hypothetical protein [Xanthomonadales bacterium]
MRMKLLAGLASLVFLALSSAAQAFITLDAIVPDSPMEGESVAVRVSAGLCDSIIEADGYPQITQSGNSIRMLLATTYTDDIILCNSEPGTVDLPFGEFSAGTYTLQLDRQYVDFFGATIVETVGTEGFAVSGFAGGTALPMLGPGGLLFLVLSMIAVVWLTLSRRHGCGVVVVLVVLLFPPGTEAQTAPESNRYVQVLLSSNSGAPPAEEVVSYYGSSPPVGPPPLQAFQVVEPVDAGYLLPLRATGDFLAYLEANPDIARARLERYLLVEYPPTTNMEAAVTSLSNDPNVLAAYLPQESDFSSVSVLEFGLTSPNSGLSYPIGPLGTPVQYGWDALNVAAAWELAGGYALIGTADTGLATSHAALRQFSSAGQYLGGNVNPGSLDLGDWPTSYDADVNEVTPMPLDPNSACNPKHLPAVEPARAGHGTHVAGLQAANSTSVLLLVEN